MGFLHQRPLHKWITFYNPRNGRVRIQACELCGIAKGLEIGVPDCIEVPPAQNRMRVSGWQELKTA